MRLVDMYHFYTHLLKVPDVRLHFLVYIFPRSQDVYRQTFKQSLGPKLSAG